MELIKINFSQPGKMPWLSWSRPAWLCNIGMYLAEIAGSTCFDCYACKGRYKFSNTKNALEFRESQYEDNPKIWMLSIIDTLNKKIKRIEDDRWFFRWFDSGDLKDYEMFDMICRVAFNCPEIRFWLPTKERDIIRTWIKDGKRIPDNLTVRLSDYHVDKRDTLPKILKDFPTAGVVSDKKNATCPAYKQDGKCGKCRKCWYKTVSHINYPIH